MNYNMPKRAPIYAMRGQIGEICWRGQRTWLMSTGLAFSSVPRLRLLWCLDVSFWDDRGDSTSMAAIPAGLKVPGPVFRSSKSATLSRMRLGIFAAVPVRAWRGLRCAGMAQPACVASCGGVPGGWGPASAASENFCFHVQASICASWKFSERSWSLASVSQAASHVK